MILAGGRSENDNDDDDEGYFVTQTFSFSLFPFGKHHRLPILKHRVRGLIGQSVTSAHIFTTVIIIPHSLLCLIGSVGGGVDCDEAFFFIYFLL